MPTVAEHGYPRSAVDPWSALDVPAAPLPAAAQALEGLASRAVDPRAVEALERDGVRRARED